MARIRTQPGSFTMLCHRCRDLHRLYSRLRRRVDGSQLQAATATPFSPLPALPQLPQVGQQTLRELEACYRQFHQISRLLEDERQRLLLEYRYLQDLPWATVANLLDLAIRQTMYLHRQALAQLNDHLAALPTESPLHTCGGSPDLDSSCREFLGQ